MKLSLSMHAFSKFIHSVIYRQPLISWQTGLEELNLTPSTCSEQIRLRTCVNKLLSICLVNCLKIASVVDQCYKHFFFKLKE